MMVLTCYAVDDEFASLKTLESFIYRDNRLVLLGAEKNAIRASKRLAADENVPDILFLDVEMKGINGPALANIVKDIERVMVVYTTGHKSYAVEAFDYGAVDYLLKPFSFERFKLAIDRCISKRKSVKIEKWRNKGPKDIFVKDTRTHTNARITKDILMYIKSLGNYSEIYQEGKSKIMVKISAKKLLLLLDAPNLIKIHKSFIINLDRVDAFDGKSIILSDKTEIDIGPGFRMQFKKQFDLISLTTRPPIK